MVKTVCTEAKHAHSGSLTLPTFLPRLHSPPLLLSSPSHSIFPLLRVPPQFESQAASSLEGVIISQGCGLSLPLAIWRHLGSSQGKNSSSWHNLCALELRRPRAVRAAVTKPESALVVDADAAAGHAGREEQQPSRDPECACSKQGDERNNC